MGVPFFNLKCAIELTDIQSLFLHWVEVYDWIFSLPDSERPSDEVIDTDSKFDLWYKNYVAQKMKEHRQASSGTQGKGKTASSHKNTINF